MNRQNAIVLGTLVAVATVTASPATSGRTHHVPELFSTVAAESGVPVDVLYSVALAESGKRIGTGSIRPYPWTVVTRGKPARFESKRAAVEAVRALLHAGTTNVDVGLMQTNLHWHGYRYASISAALEPESNLRTGARILVAEYESPSCRGDWWCAVGRYHSYRKSDGQAYTQRVKKLHGVVAGKGAV